MMTHTESEPEVKQTHWLEIAEAISVVGAIGGSVAAAVSQQLILASLPLSLAVALNWVNRRRLLSWQSQAQQRSQTMLVQLHEAQQTQQTQLTHLNDQVFNVQTIVNDLNRGTKDLHDYTQLLSTEQKQMSEVVVCLREIENFTQAIHANPNYAKAYYNRGLTHQRLGDLQGAIADYSEAIQLQPTYAKAYHNRGVARSNLRDRKGALEDLRMAAKLFFEQGDIDSYQKAKDLSRRLHDLHGHDSLPTEKVAIECLFS